MKKRVLAIMLACLMLVSLLPMGALAADGVQITCPGKGANHDLSNCPSTFVEKVVPTCGTENFGYDIYSCNVCGDLFAANFYKGDKNSKHDWVLTEDKDGYCAYYECSVCGAKDDTKNHEWDKATCTEAATCKLCGKTSGKPLGHTFGNTPSKIITAPNEQTFENGLAEYNCTVCGKAEQVVILAHKCEENLKEVAAQDATCVKDGNKAHFACEICDRLYVLNDKGALVETAKEEIIIKGEHVVPQKHIIGSIYRDEYTDIDGDGIAQLAPTCTTPGYNEFVCVTCKEKVKQIVEPQHNWTPKVIYDASCSTYGYTIFICDLCGKEDFAITPPLKHSERPENEGEYYFTAATCAQNAYYEWLCTKCYEYVVEEIPGTALGHDLKTVTVPATCGAYGYTYTYCARQLKDFWGEGYHAACQDFPQVPTISTQVPGDANGDGKVDKNETVTYMIWLPDFLPIVTFKIDVAGGFSKTNHVRPEDAIAIEPTCDKTGLIAYWCVNCEKDVIEVLPATGHTKAEKPVPVPATCQSAGYEAYLCVDCGKPVEVVKVLTFSPKAIYESEKEVMALHVDKNGNSTAVMTGNWRPGDCETVGLYRYECTTCKEVMLVKDAATGHHTAPANLPARPAVLVYTFTSEQGFFQMENPMLGAAVEYTVTLDWNGADPDSFGWYFNFSEEAPTEAYQLYGYIESEEAVSCTVTFTPAAGGAFAGKAPTCTENGYTAQYNCAVCGEFVPSETYIPAVKDEDGKVITEAVHPELAALGHDKLNHIKPVAPTCTTAGVTEGFTCGTCGLVVKSEPIPALGHDLKLEAEFLAKDQFSGELYICQNKGCGEKFIKNYEAICTHEWEFDRKASSTSTCTKHGYEVYVCANCGETKKIELELAPHVNQAGQILCQCESKLPDDNKCVNCEQKIVAIGQHTFGEWTVYVATCTTEAYMIHECEFCPEYEVIKIAEPTGHDWKYEAAVKDEKTGVIVGAAYRCSACGATKIEDADAVTFSIKVENAAKAGDKIAITDGSLVKVTISITGKQDGVWGFKFDVPFSANMDLVKTNYCVDIAEDFDIVANNNSSKEQNLVTIAGNANGSANATIDGTVALVELYFVVDQDMPGKVELAIDNAQILNYKGEAVLFIAAEAEAKTVALMDVNADGKIDMADILATYKLIVDGKYEAAADIDKNGIIEADDLQNMYKFLIGAKTYAATRKIGIAAV